jgi:hypothetical protein
LPVLLPEQFEAIALPEIPSAVDQEKRGFIQVAPKGTRHISQVPSTAAKRTTLMAWCVQKIFWHQGKKTM